VTAARALAAAALLVAAGCRTAAPPELSSPPEVTAACAGATAIPLAVDAILNRLSAPTRDHCERHLLGGRAALFVRTMNTVAHDEAGGRVPACRWEVFRVPPEPVAHVGSLLSCRLRVDGRCIFGLDPGDAAAPQACLDASGNRLR
jgi:hypothetical protein